MYWVFEITNMELINLYLFHFDIIIGKLQIIILICTKKSTTTMIK